MKDLEILPGCAIERYGVWIIPLKKRQARKTSPSAASDPPFWTWFIENPRSTAYVRESALGITDSRKADSRYLLPS